MNQSDVLLSLITSRKRPVSFIEPDAVLPDACKGKVKNVTQRDGSVKRVPVTPGNALPGERFSDPRQDSRRVLTLARSGKRQSRRIPSHENNSVSPGLFALALFTVTIGPFDVPKVSNHPVRCEEDMPCWDCVTMGNHSLRGEIMYGWLWYGGDCFWFAATHAKTVLEMFLIQFNFMEC
jgi:hypothetical protein